MPRTRSSRAEAAARSISGLLVDIFRTNRRRRISSSSSSEDFVTNSEDTSTTTTESSTSETDSDDENFEPRRRTPYHTRASDRRNRNSVSGANNSPNSDQDNESEEEEARGDSGSVIMSSHDDDDVQIIEGDAAPPSNSNSRSAQSDSDSELNIVNRPKRRRTDNFATDEEEDTKPGVSSNAAPSASVPDDDGSADDGCTICYEEYTSAGEHRLASVKCGHFFGYSCIARWIRSEGRNAVCPTCKTKTTIKDIRKHYANAVKVTDTAEVEMLRNSNAALHVKVSGLEVELARKDREISDLLKRLQEGKPHDIISSTPQLIVPRGGRMFMNPERKEALMNGTSNADARAMDFNGEFWAIGVACSQARNIFNPYGIRMLTITRQEFKLRECYPLHNGRSRVVVFSPFESTLLLSGGEDKRAIVSMNGAIRRQWKMPNDKPVWTGCWTAANKVALGLGDGRVFEYAVDSDSTEPIRDYTLGIGHLPIIFTGFDPASSTLLVASFKKLIAIRNDRIFPLLSNADDHFDKMRSVSFDESSLHFAVTFSPGGRHPGISHRLYRLEVDDDNDEAMIRYPSSAVVASIRAIPTSCDSRKTIVVLADKALFSIAFGLSDAVS